MATQSVLFVCCECPAASVITYLPTPIKVDNGQCCDCLAAHLITCLPPQMVNADQKSIKLINIVIGECPAANLIV